MTPRPALAAALAALLTLTGGCSVSTSSPRDDDRASTPASRDDERVLLDLSDGLTREEAGIAPGEATASWSHPGGRTVDATVVLGPGVAVRRDATLVAVSGDSVVDPEAEPTSVELIRRVDGVDEARDELERAVDEVGIPADEVADWADQASAAVAADDPVSYQTRVFRGTDVDGIGVEVEAALAVDGPRVSVRYVFTLPG